MRRTERGVEQAAEFGQRVRSRRREIELSQEQLADACGVHRTYIGHLERGEVNPTLYNIVRVAAALRTDPAELVRGIVP